jgi:hypothetical protein
METNDEEVAWKDKMDTWQGDRLDTWQGTMCCACWSTKPEDMMPMPCEVGIMIPLMLYPHDGTEWEVFGFEYTHSCGQTYGLFTTGGSGFWRKKDGRS